MTYKLQDLIDIKHFQNLQDRLNRIYSFPSAIVDNDGNILTATAWQDLCTKFHRQHPDCERECRLSDQYILSLLHEANPAVSYRCPHGLVDNATPIVIDGIHYGNFFTGQFFLEKPDLEFFRAQARKYGFDEAAYLKAVEKVPIWTQDQLASYLFFIKGLIAVISESGLKRLKEMETRRQIEASEERYRTLFERANDGIVILSADGRLMSVNHSFALMHGYSPEEMLHLSLKDLDTPETLRRAPGRMTRLLAGEVLTFEVEHYHKDGHVFPLEVSASLTSSVGEPCIQGFHRDITKRKRAEEELLRNQQRLELAQRSAGAGLWDWDVVSGRIDWSQELLGLFGLDPGRTESGFEAWRQAVHPEDRERALHRIEQAIKDGTPLASEYRVVLPDGGIRWINALGNTVYDQNRRPLRMSGICLDITARKRGEAALLASESTLRSLFDTISESVFLMDVHGKILAANGTFAARLGKRPEDCVGKSAYDLLPPEIAERRREWIDAVLRTGESATYEDRREGRWMAHSITPILGAKGVPERVVVFAVDITRHKQAEERLRQSEARLRNVIDAYPVPSALNDEQGNITYLNPAFSRTFGYDIHEVPALGTVVAQGLPRPSLP